MHPNPISSCSCVCICPPSQLCWHFSLNQLIHYVGIIMHGFDLVRHDGIESIPKQIFSTTLYCESRDPPPSVSHLINICPLIVFTCLSRSPRILPLGPSHAGGGADPTVSAGPVSRALPVHHSGQDDAACSQPAHSDIRAHWVL